MKIDDTDHQIINVLKQDARKSIRDIAKEINLRPSTVHARIKKLTKEGIIEKFTLKLNNEAVDESFIVFTLLNTDDLDPRVIKDPRVKEIFGITGEYDLIMKAKFKDVGDFNDFVIDLRKKHEIRETLSMVATANIKEAI